MNLIKNILTFIAGKIADSTLLLKVTVFLYFKTQTLLGNKVATIIKKIPVYLTGLPFFKFGVRTNLHSFGLYMRIQHSIHSTNPTKKKERNKNNHPLRIGIVGEFLPWGGKPISLIRDFPKQHSLVAFDIGKNREYYTFPERENVTVKKHTLELDYEKNISKLTNDINASELDFLILANFDYQEKCDILHGVDVPCIIHYMMSIDPIFSSKVDYSLYMLPNRNFYLQNDSLYSNYTKTFLPSERFYELQMFAFADCSVSTVKNPSWQERENLVIFHGGVERKLAYPEYLSTITELLHEDSTLRFAFLGPGSRNMINAHFKGQGLANRIEDHGCVAANTPEAHETIINLLRRGRLAPDPWPHGGGRTRIEAYWAGIPSVHLGMRQDGKIIWERASLNQVDLPYIEVPHGTSHTQEDYKTLCKKCLYDEAFANTIIQEQYTIARHAIDSNAWWEDVIDSHDHWLHGTGWCG